MHNNFYYLRQVSTALASRIGDAVVSECFSQNKDELIIRFEIGTESFYIRASLSPSLGCLSFPSQFQRARKNSVDLFRSIVGTRVTQVRQFENERSFALILSDNKSVLFKMHGSRTNVVVFDGHRVEDIFRKNLTADQHISPDQLDREIDWSREHFEAHIDDLRAVYFTFGKVIWHYLAGLGFAAMSTDDKWQAIQDLKGRLEDPTYYITSVNGKPVLGLVDVGDTIKVLHDPLVAANEFFYHFNQQYSFGREKARITGLLRSRLESGEAYCRKNSARLDEVLQDNHYKVWADLLMANLHAIDAGAESVVLENFYEEQRPTEVKLRKDLTPQKNAEVYYRKAKNQHIEIERLERSIEQKERELALLRQLLDEVDGAPDAATLRSIESRISNTSDKGDRVHLPYHEFEFSGYRILVGKNAQSNDVLTLKHSYKEDLWLHAKDVSGSHVLIKHQAGKNFPKDVIEYAASLAAFNSKRRSESLCPVIVTPKKYVRKRKGDPPGMVVVEKEDVILVPPATPDQIRQ